jgi:hypothetical protein
MHTDIPPFEYKYRLAGQADVLLPNGRLAQISRLYLWIWGEADYQVAELTLQLAVTDWELAAACFPLTPGALIYRFRMDAQTLAPFCGALTDNLPPAQIVTLGDAAFLRLENYTFVGESAWFEDTLTN